MESVKNKEVTIWSAKTIDEFVGALGETVDLDSLKEAKKKLVIKTLYGDVDMQTYDALVASKLYSYFQYGVAYRVAKMMKEQSKDVDTNDIKVVLLEMARLELEYGLRPITHVIPVNKSTYIKADGYLFYGKNSGKLKSIKYEEDEKNGVWTTKCVLETTDGTFDGIATVRPTGARMDDPREKARTKSMRRALRKAFPIGASDEPLEEISPVAEVSEIQSVEPIEDLSQLIETPKTPQNEEKKTVDDKLNEEEKPSTGKIKQDYVKELYHRLKELPPEEHEKKKQELQMKFKVLSLAMLTDEQAKEALESLS